MNRVSGDARGLTMALAERSSSLTYEALPEDVIELARQCLLDWFGVTVGGSYEDGTLVLLEVIAAGAQDGERPATVVGHAARLAPLQAALVNGTSSHGLDFDDVNLAFLGHVSAPSLAAALALAEQLDAHARELLTAFVAGYETACRIAAALGPEPYLRGLHSTGTIGTFASAAACARLLGLDAQHTAIALSIAASEAAGLKCNFGTMTKALHAGKACENGLLAALLAARGFTAGPSAIEAEQGFAAVAGGSCDASAALAEPAAGWHLRENVFKYHAACFFTHSAIEGLRELTAAGAVRVEEVERVTVHVSELETGACVIPEPSTALEVKFSLAHLAAMALLERPTSRMTDGDAADPEVIALRSKVALADDAAPGAPTLVEVRLRDGRVSSACHDVNTPERDLAVQRRRLQEKFTALAEPVLGAHGARGLLAELSELEDGHTIRALMALACP